MSKLGCNVCLGLLPDYVDGKLDAEHSATMREHLSVSQPCANEAERLHELFTQALTRVLPDAGIPDPGSFLVGINAEIDRRRARLLPGGWKFPRPAIHIPVLSTAIVLIIFSLFYFPSVGPSNSADGMFSGLITESDVKGLPEIETLVPLLSEVLVSDLSTGNEMRASEIAAFDDQAALNTAIDGSLLDDVSFSSVVSASLEYISTEDVLDQLSEEDTDEIVTTLQNQSIMLL